jgi:hypothetical protein
VGLDKLDTTARGVEPLRVFLDIVERKRAYESESALKPHRFGGIHYVALPVEACIYSAVYRVEAFLNPEWHYVALKVGLVSLGALA